MYSTAVTSKYKVLSEHFIGTTDTRSNENHLKNPHQKQHLFTDYGPRVSTADEVAILFSRRIEVKVMLTRPEKRTDNG
jgi:hypothetical protein